MKLRSVHIGRPARARSTRRMAAAPAGAPHGRLVMESAFTLMEVMIAVAVFSIGVVAILGLVASVLRGARLLDKPMVDAGVVASEIAQTNKLVEIQGTSGDLSEFLGDNYKGYEYVYGITEIESNHLYEAEILLTSDAPGKPLISKLDVLLFRPLSPPGSLDFGGQLQ
ncbi:MAG: type IV pilus modification PilV family protein [Limisphaerales bacterium]